MKLYEFPPTRSIRARWTLQELGVDFQSITVDLLNGEHRSPQFLAINPAGKVPVLVDDGRVVTESGSRVTVADFVVAYTLDWGTVVDLLDECPHLLAYVERMYARPKAAMRIEAAFASLGI